MSKKPERAAAMKNIRESCRYEKYKRAVAPVDPSNVTHPRHPSVSTETLTHELASCYYRS